MEAKPPNSSSQRLKYLMTKLNSSQNSHVFRALVEIRTKYFTPTANHQKQFVQEGGLKLLVIQLQKNDKKIIDVTLSILGHCVLEQEPRILFRKAGGLPILVQVLRSAEENNILTRACRALGSLVHDRRNSMKLIELSIQDTICHLLVQTENEEVICMAVRAVKNLADCKEHVAALGRCCLIPKLWHLLTKYENQNILKSLLATLCHICNYMHRFSENSSHYWVGTEGGGKFIARLVVLCHNDVQAISSKAFQLFQQTIQDQHVRPFLTGKEAFESLIPVVLGEKDLNRRSWTIYMTSLFMLGRENPHMFRRAGGIPVLLDLIKQSDPDSCDSTDSQLSSHHSSIFGTLLAFKNDTESLAELSEGGVVDILVEKITRCIESSKNQRIKPVFQIEMKSPENQLFTPTRESLEEDGTGLNSHICEAENNNSVENQDTEHRSRRPESRTRFRSKRQYRTTSPSYQAVEMEYDQLFRLRESSSSDVLNIFGWNSNSSRNDLVSSPSSPQSLTSSISPNHSSWSDYGSDGDGGSDSYSLSPTCVTDIPSPSVCVSPNRSESSSPVGSLADSPLSPLLPSTSRSSSESGETDEEDNNTICYSPANFDLSQLESPGSSPAPPPGKKAKVCNDSEKLCCESDLKMSWLHLGQVEGKDFFENWPEFQVEKRRYQPVEWAIYMLHRLSWLSDTPRQLTEPRVIKTLIDYLTETSQPTFYACRTLFRLASHPDLFTSLLRSYFPLEVYLRLVRNASMKHCCPLHSSLRRVGEQILEQISSIVSQFGRGEMENVLLKTKEDASTQVAVALATPVIVKSRCLLRYFLIELDVLEMICNLLKDGNSVDYAAASLSSLGNFLKMDDLLCPSTNLNEVFNSELCQTMGLQDDVFFQMSSKENVGAIKEKLNSPFFQAMFRGGFSESNSTVVPLPNVEVPVLQTILHVTYGCGRQCKYIASIDSLIKCDRLAISLLQSMDRFLLLQYSEQMCNLVGSQDWRNTKFPGNYIAMFKSLYRLADCPSRVKIIQTFLHSTSSIAENVVEDWKNIFLSRIDDN